MPETGAELLARIKPRLHEDFTNLCLRPDLLAEYEERNAELLDLQTSTAPKRNAGGVVTGARELAERVEALRKEITDSEIKFVFRSLTRDAFRALCDTCPPRYDDALDNHVGYNREAVSDALVRASLLEPVFDGITWEDIKADGTKLGTAQEGADWRALLEVISVGEWAEMRRVAEKVNGSVVTEAPKAGLASRILRSPANDSEPEPASEPVPESSTAP